MLRVLAASAVLLSACGGSVTALPSPDASSLPGCTKDTDCKGDRICEDGRCVEPVAPDAAAALDAEVDAGVQVDAGREDVGVPDVGTPDVGPPLIDVHGATAIESPGDVSYEWEYAISVSLTNYGDPMSVPVTIICTNDHGLIAPTTTAQLQAGSATWNHSAWIDLQGLWGEPCVTLNVNFAPPVGPPTSADVAITRASQDAGL